jgi:hypothetical protein
MKKIFLYIALILPFIILFVICNFINIHRSNWFFHPDERDVYVFSQQLYRHGNLVIDKQSSINPAYTTPDGSTENNGKILPGRSYGIYILLAPFFLLGSSGPFYAIPIFGLLTLLFLFLITKQLFNYKVAYISILLLGYSPHFIIWNNMLFSNIPALMFLLGGIYFYIKNNKLQYISPLFFSFSIILRYEYAIYVFLVLFSYFIIEKRKSIKKIFLTSFIMLVLFSPLPLLNHAVYGNYFSVGYIQKSYDLNTGKTIDYSKSNKPGILGIAQKITNRFGGQFNSKMPKNFAINFSEYLISIVPILIILGIMGIVQQKRKIFKDPIILSLILIIFFTLFYFGTAAGFNGFHKAWLVSSYTRYFLPIITALSVFSAYALVKFLENRLIVIGGILLVYFITSLNTAYSKNLGLKDIEASKKDNKSINYMAKALPYNAVIISNFYSKVIIDRPVLLPNLTAQEKGDRLRNTQDIVKKNILKNKFYILENVNHSSYVGIADYLKDSGYKIAPIDINRGLYEVKR